MPPLPGKRIGERLAINERIIPFSFWPVKSVGRGPRSVQTQIYTNDPWNIVEGIINSKCPTNRKESAHYFFEQAKDYYKSTQGSSILAAKPLQTYYCLLNLMKTYILTYGSHDNLDTAKHGLSESNAGIAITNHNLQYFQSNANNINIIDEVFNLISGNRLPDRSMLNVNGIFEQTILGHRLWCDASSSSEKFLRVAEIRYYRTGNNDAWVNLYVFKDDLVKLHLNQSDVASLSGIGTRFRQVNEHELVENRETICLEQINVLHFQRNPSNIINELSSQLKNDLWEILVNTTPYKKYYLLLEQPPFLRINQWCNIYALSYYLGSITRYRPKQFADLIKGPYGPQIQEFVNHQIYHFIYAIASIFSRREILKPGII